MKAWAKGRTRKGPHHGDRWTDLQHFQRLRGVQDAGLRLGVAGLVPSTGREPAPRCVRGSALRRQGWGDSPPPHDNDRSDSLPPSQFWGGDNGHLSPGAGAWHWAGASAGGSGQ